MRLSNSHFSHAPYWDATIPNICVLKSHQSMRVIGLLVTFTHFHPHVCGIASNSCNYYGWMAWKKMFLTLISHLGITTSPLNNWMSWKIQTISSFYHRKHYLLFSGLLYINSMGKYIVFFFSSKWLIHFLHPGIFVKIMDKQYE